jgi:cytochrome c556
MPARWLAALAAMFVLGIGLLVVVDTGAAADKDKETPEEKAARKDAQDAVVQLADMMGDAKKGDDVKKMAKELAERMIKADIGEDAVKPVMSPLRLRDKGGLGVGPKAGVYDPDGIEAKILALAKKKLTAAEAKKQADDIARLASVTAAIGEVAELHVPPKKVGAKDPKDWKKWSNEMRDDALDLAKTVQAAKPDPDKIKAAATKLNGTCTDCHDKFRPK